MEYKLQCMSTSTMSWVRIRVWVRRHECEYGYEYGYEYLNMPICGNPLSRSNLPEPEPEPEPTSTGTGTSTGSWVRVRLRVLDHEYGYEYTAMSTGTATSTYNVWVRVRVWVSIGVWIQVKRIDKCFSFSLIDNKIEIQPSVNQTETYVARSIMFITNI